MPSQFSKHIDNILAQRILQGFNRFIHQDQVSFILEMEKWYSLYKSVNVIHYVNRMKDKSYIIISVEVEKTLKNFNSNIHS